MKTATLAALLISAAATTGFAATPAFAGDNAAVATNAPLTRAEVKAELARARASGELDNPNRPDYPAQLATGGYTVPRAQITSAGFSRTARAATPATSATSAALD